MARRLTGEVTADDQHRRPGPVPALAMLLVPALVIAVLLARQHLLVGLMLGSVTAIAARMATGAFLGRRCAVHRYRGALGPGD